MATVTTPVKPRFSNIPTPGRSSIPTPGRPRSASVAGQRVVSEDAAAMDRAFADAIKANDPSRHLSSQNNLSPQSASTARRPQSAASQPRPKTPTSSLNKSTYKRPESRQSDVFSRSQRSFLVGDNVRIESLGFEGSLRYIGEIDGKQGQWAGVEVSGGFAGKGKNDGTVDGKRYFQCPPKCGVFVSLAKLSAPTVGPGAYPRPPSVASSRASLSGRLTPSFTGYATPSESGRVTPLSNGRITPSSSFTFSTPSARPRASLKSTSRQNIPPPSNTPSATAMSKITAGSRASKYIGVTAKHLSSRDLTLTIPPSPSRGSPTRSFSSASPIRPIGITSPVETKTPKATRMGLGTPKTVGKSFATPKARIPSAIAMPPPPSPSSNHTSRSVSLGDKPITPTFSSTSNDTMVEDEPESLSALQQNGRLLQEKIKQLMSGKASPTEIDSPFSSLVMQDSGNRNATIDSLQNRLENLEREHAALKAEKQELADVAKKLPAIQTERDQAFAKAVELEAQVKTFDRSMKERETKVETLERSLQTSADSLERQKAESESRARDLQAKVDDSENLISSLKEAVEAKANEAGENAGVIQAKNAEIALLEARTKKVSADLEETRSELGAQVDELRLAGQETIALYEERLSAAETKRYELEDTIGELQEQLKTQLRPPSPNSIAKHASKAAQIDNENLREQVVHLQKKISNLEDMLEDARAMSDKEDVAIKARIQKYKDTEILLKKEVLDAKKEIEKFMKAEAVTRSRSEETEEALRENTMALENARAEIEGLRAELANLEGLHAGTVDKADDSFRRSTTATDRNRYEEDIANLKDLLESMRTAKREVNKQYEESQSKLAEAVASVATLRQTIETLDSQKADLEHRCLEQTNKIERDRVAMADLRSVLDEKTAELKNIHRDRPLSQDTISFNKHDGARDEIKGLKHIVQELQKENAAVQNQNRILESENKMLLSETDQLRDELKCLEENVEQSILREEKAIDEGVPSGSNDVAELQKTVKDMKTKYELDMEHLRKKVSDAEMKNARTIHDLNKEVSELETLIEAKIYREDDLEREIEHLKEKLARTNKKTSRSSMEGPLFSSDPHHHTRSARPSLNGDRVSGDRPPPSLSKEVCEICEKVGHDIFTCPLLKDDVGPTSTASVSGMNGIGGQKKKVDNNIHLFCQDCESHGHTSAECPHSMDVF